MELFITDSESIYKKSTSGEKILIKNSFIQTSEGFDLEIINRFNHSLNAIENLAAEQMVIELKALAARAPLLHTNKYLATRKESYAIAYSLLYPNFKNFVLKRIIIELILQKFLNIPQHGKFSIIALNFSHEFSLISSSDYLKSLQARITIRNQEIKRIKVSLLKNLLYGMYHIFNRITLQRRIIENKTHALLFLYDTANDIDLFKSFVDLIASTDKIKLSIIQLTSGIAREDARDACELKVSKNIDVYYFKDFKTLVKSNQAEFYDWITTVDPSFKIFEEYGLNENNDQYYAYAKRIIEQLRPDVTLYDNTGEVGRVVSDVSRYYRIPSINVEYGLFTDDALHMESNIQFTARACLGPASAQLWKKRNDPTPLHIPIGFLKLDAAKKTVYNKEEFFKSHGFQMGQPTIFFASTWSSINALYDPEKSIIITELCHICERNNWNLIIKKHPAEKDTLANEAAKNSAYDKVKVFEHKELALYEAISFADIVTTQFSGVSVEALYFKKPVLFINLNEEHNWAGLSIMKNEPYICSLSNFKEVESKLQTWISSKNIFDEALVRGLNTYLLSGDGKSSERLVNLIETLKHGV